MVVLPRIGASAVGAIHVGGRGGDDGLYGWGEVLRLFRMVEDVRE